LYNKKTVVVAGGRDITAIPQIGYGDTLQKTGRFYVPFVLDKATKVLPYSKDAKKRVLGFLRSNAKVELIYLGVDVQKFHPSGIKQDKVITVATVTQTQLKRKGLETFVKSAAYLPSVEFVLIGESLDDSIRYLRSIAPKNVKFEGFLKERELIRSYQEAKVYVQVSAHEAFGVAVAEAMACGCIPVVTEKGSLPEVVGNTGVYVAYGDPAATAAGIEQALKSGETMAPRRRVERMFTTEKRRTALLTAINNLLT
jgi:glycosyltransferase involved in cell wall biosynthesis